MEAQGKARKRRFARIAGAALLAVALIDPAVARAEHDSESAELALRLGLADVAFEHASSSFSAMQPGPARDKAFLVAAVAKERFSTPADTLAWLDNVSEAPPSARWFRARALVALGRTEEAAETLRRFVSGLNAGDPLAAPARKDLAHALSLLGEDTEASAVVSEGRDDPDASIDAFELATRIAAGSDASQEIPTPVRALAFATAAAIRAGNADSATAASDAQQFAERALALAADDPATLAECRSVLLAIQALHGKSESALETARSIVAEDRSSSASTSLLNAASTLLARPDATVSDASNALAIANLHESSFSIPAAEWETQRLRALALEKTSRVAEAIAAWDSAAVAASVSGDISATAEARLEAIRLSLAENRSEEASIRMENARKAGIPEALEARASRLEAECLAASDSREAPLAFERAATVATESSDEREATIRAAETTPPGDPALSTRAAAAEAALSEIVAAVTTDTDRAAVDRREASAALAVAVNMLRAGNIDGAVANLENAAAKPQGGEAFERARALLPAAYQAVGRDDEALAAYDIFTNAHPASAYLPDLRFWRASLDFNSGKWASAADSLLALCSEFPDSSKTPHSIYLAAVALLRAGREEEAIEAVDHLAAIDPDSPLLPQARFMQADALASLMRFDAAALAYSRVTSSSGTDPALPLRASMRRADCLYALGGEIPSKRAESLAIYRQVLADPACAKSGLAPECRWKIGRALAKDGDGEAALGEWYEGCIEPFERAPDATAAPWYSRAVFSAAAALVDDGRKANAITLLSRLATSEDLPGREEAARRIDAIKTTP